MRKILLTTLFTLLAAAAFAQRGTLTATIVDGETGDTVAGAVLTIAPTADPDKRSNMRPSAYKGAVSVAGLPYGKYELRVAFLGYNDYTTEFEVAGATCALGTIRLRPGVQIETVVKEVKAMRTSQRGDTVSYNADAFKVAGDADVEGLLKKMPGITVTDGTVEAQGEEIKKIFVDGKGVFRRGRHHGDQVAPGRGGEERRGLQQTLRCGRVLGHGRRRGL